jgi:hypothetical protein
MPLSKGGNKVMAHMKQTYGSKAKAEEVFYASMNAHKPGSAKWEKNPKKGK